MNIIIPVLTLGILGLVFGIGLAYAMRIFSVEKDPRLEKIIESLPGSNCGACGFAGCAGLADALISHKTTPDKCALGGEKVQQTVARILGVSLSPKVKLVSTLRCSGGVNAKDKFDYRGLRDCWPANTSFGGHKACPYGCIGFGSCVSVCPVGAISMGDKGIPVVDINKCIACGKCLKGCPKNLYRLIPVSSYCYVKCSCHDKGREKAAYCKSACIACGICQKESGGVFFLENNLSRLDYEKKTDFSEWGRVMAKCPTKVIVKL